MKKITTLIFIKYLIFKRRILNRLQKNKFSLWLFISLFILITGFTFYFCKHLFGYIHDFDETGKLLNLKILEYFAIFLLLIDLLSNIIVALNIIMENKEFCFLMSFPISHSSMCLYKALEICFISNWMAYLIGFTIFSAWAMVTGINMLNFIFVFAILWAFLLFMTSLIAFLIIQVILYLFPVRWISRLIHFTIISISVSIIFILRALKPEKLINPDVRGVLKNYILGLSMPFENFYPTHWLISTFTGNTDFLSTIMLLAMLIAILLVLIIFTGKKSLYRKIAFYKKKDFKKQVFKKISIFTKDLKVFFRTQGELNQLIIVFGIILIYAYNMMIIPQRTIIQTFAVNLLNMGIFILIMITVSSRFILSSFCKDADTICLLMKCPLSKKHIIQEKLKFAFIFNIPLSIFLSILTISLLKLPLFFQIYNLIIGICTGLIISFITVYYSIIIFDYKKSRPEALIMTPTGVTFMVVSFLIAMIFVVLYFVLLNVYFVKMFTNGQYGIFLSYVFLLTCVIFSVTFLVCKVYYDRGIVKLGILYSDYERKIL